MSLNKTRKRLMQKVERKIDGLCNYFVSFDLEARG